MTREQEDFVLSKYGLYSYKHLSSELSVSINDIVIFLQSKKKFKPRIPYSKRTQEWKQEVAEYIRNHSLSDASKYFCVSGVLLSKIIDEFSI